MLCVLLLLLFFYFRQSFIDKNLVNLEVEVKVERSLQQTGVAAALQCYTTGCASQVVKLAASSKGWMSRRGMWRPLHVSTTSHTGIGKLFDWWAAVARQCARGA